jgi:predicted transcriptional regulator
MASVKKLFSLDENIARELDIVAEALHKSQKEIVESALDFYFDYTDGLVADKITQDIKLGKMKVYESKDVYKELGIEL